MIETRTIKFDRLNVSLRIILAFIMLGIGIWFAFGNTDILNKIPKLDDSIFKKFMGFITIMLMCVAILFLFKCLLTKKPGLTIDKYGVAFQNTIIPKYISWSEIKRIEKFDLKFFFFSWTVLNIVMDDFEESKKMISPFLLNISLPNLLILLNENLKNYRQ